MASAASQSAVAKWCAISLPAAEAKQVAAVLAENGIASIDDLNLLKAADLQEMKLDSQKLLPLIQKASAKPAADGGVAPVFARQLSRKESDIRAAKMSEAEAAAIAAADEIEAKLENECLAKNKPGKIYYVARDVRTRVISHTHTHTFA